MMILLDTNVWADYYVPNRVNHDAAAKLIDSACAQGIGLLYAVNSSRDVYYRICADMKRECRDACDGKLTDSQALACRAMGWSCIDHMTEIATAVGCDTSDVWLARKQRNIHGDYEDNLVIAAAQRAQADFLVTGDKALLQHCPVVALDVEDMIAYLEAA